MLSVCATAAGNLFAMAMMHELSWFVATVGGSVQFGDFMKISAAISFSILTATMAFPAQAKELPEHVVLAFNLPACPKGWVEYTAATGKVPGLLFCEKHLNRR